MDIPTLFLDCSSHQEHSGLVCLVGSLVFCMVGYLLHLGPGFSKAKVNGGPLSEGTSHEPLEIVCKLESMLCELCVFCCVWMCTHVP